MFGKKNEKLNKKLDEVTQIISKANLEEIANIMGNKKQIIFRNFLAGISRGVGIGIGVTVITAVLLKLLQRIVTLNIPIIGEFVADVIDIVKQEHF